MPDGTTDAKAIIGVHPQNYEQIHPLLSEVYKLKCQLLTESW